MARFDFPTRPCILTTPRRGGAPEECKALCHGFFPVAEVVPPSMMRGGHQGGQLADVQALIELEDGTLRRVEVSRLRFTDAPERFEAYDWGDTGRIHPQELYAFYKRIAALPDCNTCTGKGDWCHLCPKPGEQTRINCPLYEGPEVEG